MDLELSGKTAIVTGGSTGIGKAIARELAKEGVDVAICARTRETLEASAAEIAAETGRRIVPIVADVSKLDSVEIMVKKAVTALGGVDILVNNVGLPGGLARGPLETVTDEIMWEDLNTKFMGYLRCARASVPYMKRKKWGRIINIGGMSARRSGTYSTGARNVAVAHMTKTLSDELGQYGITANCIHPGGTWIEKIEEAHRERAKREGKTLEQVKTESAKDIAIRRWPESFEVAYVAVFLASPKSITITGEVFSVSGGFSRALFT